MLYPVMPIYLESIGFSIILIGLLEGFAEAIAGLSKGYFGKLSDISGRRAIFVQAGYAMSALSKPLLVLFTAPIWVFFSRTIDRFGKGIRTGARDALLSDESTPQTKGKVFGFHRSMDTLGAVFGPLLALSYLFFYPNDYKTLFLIAFVPGLLAVISSLLIKDKSKKIKDKKSKVSFFSFISYWKESPKAYRKLVIGLLFFTLINSSDVFLLLQAKKAGLNDTFVIGIYIFYNLIYALFAFPLGVLADKIGLKTIFIFGLLFFSLVYFGMAVNQNLYVFFGLFFLYGIYAAATEGISKAWISTLIDKKDAATALGTFSAFQSICSMLASTITGILWFQFGSTFTFTVIASLAILVIIYFLSVSKPFIPLNEKY